MSAWMISDAHADLLATAYVALIDPQADPQLMGRELLFENAKSLRARYGDNTNFDRCELYVYHPWPLPLSTTLVSKAAACADYQCCEHDGWGISASCKALTALEQLQPYWHALGERMPWGIDEAHRHSALLSVVQ